MPSFSLVGALEFRHVVASLQHQAASPALSMFETPLTPYAGGHYYSHGHSRSVSRSRTPRTSLTSREEDPWDAALNSVPLDERTRPRLLVTPALSHATEESHEGGSSDYFAGDSGHTGSITPVPSIFRTPASPTVSNGETESQNYVLLTKRQWVVCVIERVYHTLFPSLHHFSEQSALGRIASVFAAPAIMLLTITLPVVVTPYGTSHSSREKLLGGEGRLVDFEEEGIERILIAEEEVQEDMHEMLFNKWLMTAQCAFAPMFCVGVLFGS